MSDTDGRDNIFLIRMFCEFQPRLMRSQFTNSKFEGNTVDFTRWLRTFQVYRIVIWPLAKWEVVSFERLQNPPGSVVHSWYSNHLQRERNGRISWFHLQKVRDDLSTLAASFCAVLTVCWLMGCVCLSEQAGFVSSGWWPSICPFCECDFTEHTYSILFLCGL